MSNLVVNFISSNGWLSLSLRGIVSCRTMFENLPKDVRAEPAYESNISSNCALSSYLKNPCYAKLWYLFFHSLELPLLWILMTSEISWASAVTSRRQSIKWCCVPSAVSCENIPSGNLGPIRIVRYPVRILDIPSGLTWFVLEENIVGIAAGLPA